MSDFVTVIDSLSQTIDCGLKNKNYIHTSALIDQKSKDKGKTMLSNAHVTATMLTCYSEANKCAHILKFAAEKCY